MTLVQNLKGDSIREDLIVSYAALAVAYLRHRSGGIRSMEMVDCVSLDIAVRSTETPIDLAETRKSCPLIGTNSERPGEVFNNLNHMYVLIQATELLAATHGFRPTFCSPTQQSEQDGARIADLEGENWALEAYGGGDLSNNGKLAKDLRTLARRALTGNRTYLAFRTESYDQVSAWPPGADRCIRARCSKAHGGPFTVTASARLQGTLNGVSVVEVVNIASLAEIS